MKPLILNESDYIRYCHRIDDNGRNRVVVRTAERAHYVTLTDADGKVYGEISNFGEPFDFTTHVSIFPRTQPTAL